MSTPTEPGAQPRRSTRLGAAIDRETLALAVVAGLGIAGALLLLALALITQAVAADSFSPAWWLFPAWTALVLIFVSLARGMLRGLGRLFEFTESILIESGARLLLGLAVVFLLPMGWMALVHGAQQNLDVRVVHGLFEADDAGACGAASIVFGGLGLLVMQCLAAQGAFGFLVPAPLGMTVAFGWIAVSASGPADVVWILLRVKLVLVGLLIAFFLRTLAAAPASTADAGDRTASSLEASPATSVGLGGGP